jgi:uncharacterized surface anchored protein
VKPLLFLSLIIAIIGATQKTDAQGMCVVPLMKISSVSGRVISRTEGLPGVTMKLLDWDDHSKVIAITRTDADGRFDFTNIRPGKYHIFVKKEPWGWSTLQIPVRYKPQTGASRKVLLVHLASDVENPCAEGGAEIVPSAANK